VNVTVVRHSGFLRNVWIVLPCALLLSCGGAGTTDLTIPRGANLSVKITETLDTETSKPGDVFHAVISTPLQQGLTTYVPLDAETEGVVEESGITTGTDPRARLTLRLTGLRLPNGGLLDLDTVPLVRESGFDFRIEDIDVTTGLDVDLNRLLGRTPEGAAIEQENDPRAEIPRDSPLVFTLREDIFIPAP